MRIRRERRPQRGDRRRWRAPRARKDVVIDLTDGETESIDDRTWPDEIDLDPAIAERLAESRRRREARREAEAELLRLRARHWSGERLIEEGRRDLEWWEHPDADPYAVLGLVPGATLEEASHARRRIASENHPDLLPDDHHETAVARTRRMIAANAAYDRLKRALLPHQVDEAI